MSAPTRTFIDRAGVEWSVCVIHPERAERRTTERRQRDQGPPVGLAERRATLERRTRPQLRVRLAPAYASGWLFFVSSQGDRRRFAPIPPQWETMSTTALELMTKVAVAGTDNDS